MSADVTTASPSTTPGATANAAANPFDLTGRRALITGGARGLGEAMAEALIAAGASVAIADILDDVGTQTAKRIGATYVHLDITDDGNWEKAVAEASEQLGGLDVLVNNAGVEITSLITELDPKDIDTQLAINIKGTALGMKHGLRAMRPGGVGGRSEGADTTGSIINISSVAATIAFPGIAIYSATKSAVDRMTRVAAAESGKLGYGVRVNCIYPGLVPTEMGNGLAVSCAEAGLFESPQAAVETVVALTPSGRLGTPQDMADAVVFLASDAARFVTGVGLSVDGGMGM